VRADDQSERSKNRRCGNVRDRGNMLPDQKKWYDTATKVLKRLGMNYGTHKTTSEYRTGPNNMWFFIIRLFHTDEAVTYKRICKHVVLDSKR